MQNDFAVIGANGMQGKIVSRDLLECGYSVLLCAIDDYGITNILGHQKASFAKIDLRKKDQLRQALKDSGVKVIVNCALDDFNLEVTRIALELSIHYVDLGSESPAWQEQKKLHLELQKKGVLAISGIGSTPGITNVMLRYLAPRFDTIETVHLGFAWDSNLPVFVPPFSIDAIAYEFSEPATIFQGGTFVTKSPLEATGIDYSYRTIGKQLTCYTKHIEHHTFPEFLADKGVQNVVVYSSFPPHSYQAIRRLVELGFLSKEPIEINGTTIRPLDYTIEILRRIPIPAGYIEKENVWIKVYGKRDNVEKMEEMDCVAGTLPGWEDATCNVDTAFPASILAQMILKNQITERGFFSPEQVVPPEPFFAALNTRHMVVYDNGKELTY